MEEEIFTKAIQLLKDREAITDQLSELTKQMCDEICPYKIGDIMPNKGFSYKDKKCRVVDIFMRLTATKIEITVAAVLIKKDGSDGDSVKWQDWHDSILNDAIKRYLVAYSPAPSAHQKK